MRARTLAWVVATVWLLPIAEDPTTEQALAAEDPAAASDTARRDAIRRGVAFLTERVPKLRDVSGTPRKPFTQATMGLVLLLDGETAARTGRNPVSELRADLVRWLDRVAADSRDTSRLPPGPGVADSRCVVQYVWPVAQAALFFSEMDARNVERDEARKALRTCLTVLEEARRPNGGWGHGRFREDGARTTDLPGLPADLPVSGYPDTLVAASNCAAIGLGAARAALGTEFTLDLAPTRDYYRDARLRNGSFPYDPSQRSSDMAKINAGRTAGALVATHALGMPRDDGWKRTAAYLASERAWIGEGHGSPALNILHGALAARLLGEAEWKAYRDLFGPRLVGLQGTDGAIACPCERKAFGTTCEDPEATGIAIFAEDQRTYTTTLNTLTLLLLDGRTLKSLDRVGPAPEVTPGGRRPAPR